MSSRECGKDAAREFGPRRRLAYDDTMRHDAAWHAGTDQAPVILETKVAGLL